MHTLHTCRVMTDSFKKTLYPLLWIASVQFICKWNGGKIILYVKERKLKETNHVQEIFYSSDPCHVAVETSQCLCIIFLYARLTCTNFGLHVQPVCGCAAFTHIPWFPNMSRCLLWRHRASQQLSSTGGLSSICHDLHSMYHVIFPILKFHNEEIK
jgi:hypothetical protein